MIHILTDKKYLWWAGIMRNVLVTDLLIRKDFNEKKRMRQRNAEPSVWLVCKQIQGWEGLLHFVNSKQFIVSGKSSLTRGVARVHTRNDGQSMIMQSLYIMWRNLNFMLKLRRGDLAKHIFGNNRSDNSSAGPRFCGAW